MTGAADALALIAGQILGVAQKMQKMPDVPEPLRDSILDLVRTLDRIESIALLPAYQRHRAILDLNQEPPS